MDKHLETLRVCCRLCAKKLVKREKKRKTQHLQQQIFKLLGQNVHLDSPDVHPQFVCNSCRAVCSNAYYRSGELGAKQVFVWSPQPDNDCIVCSSLPKKYIPRKKKKGPSSAKCSHEGRENGSSTDTASHDSECEREDEDPCIVYSLFTDNL